MEQTGGNSSSSASLTPKRCAKLHQIHSSSFGYQTYPFDVHLWACSGVDQRRDKLLFLAMIPL